MDAITYVLQEMQNDDEDSAKQSRKLRQTYESAAPDQKRAIDDAFIALCGWSLATVLREAA
jgi:hypothetical protein